MKDYELSRTRRLTLVVIAVIVLDTLLLIKCTPVFGQLRLTAGAGVIDKPSFVGQLNVSYDAKSFFASGDITRQIVKTGTWFTVKSGFILQAKEFEIRPYSGIGYKITGNSHSMDRYVHNGTTEVLRNDLERNSLVIPVGMQIIRNYIFIDAGAYAGREINFYLTVGLSYKFD